VLLFTPFTVCFPKWSYKDLKLVVRGLPGNAFSVSEDLSLRQVNVESFPRGDKTTGIMAQAGLGYSREIFSDVSF